MAGSSTYPEQVDNKVELTDGVDIIQADDVNDAYVPIDAIETFLGASGAVQAKNTDILAFLESVLPDMRLVWKDADTVTVNAGRIYCKKADGSIRVLRKNTSAVDVTFADIDTGSRATSTTYYVWAVADASATTVTFKISVSSSAPTGITVIGLVGRFITNATGSGEIIEDSVLSAGYFYKNFDKQCIQARIKMNGTGTVEINESYNVSGITDNNVGDYTIAWEKDFASEHYAVGGMTHNPASPTQDMIISWQVIAAGSIRVQTSEDGSTNVDSHLSVIATGDQ